LPASVYDTASRNFKAKKSGTQFMDAAGNAVHGPVTNIYQ
jgi:hypothetical protein